MIESFFWGLHHNSSKTTTKLFSHQTNHHKNTPHQITTKQTPVTQKQQPTYLKLQSSTVPWTHNGTTSSKNLYNRRSRRFVYLCNECILYARRNATAKHTRQRSRCDWLLLCARCGAHKLGGFSSGVAARFRAFSRPRRRDATRALFFLSSSPLAGMVCRRCSLAR